MRFSVFTHVEHYLYKGRIYSYGPYVKEMNYWISEFDEIRVIAPFSEKKPGKIDTAYQHPNITIKSIPALHYKKDYFFKNLIKSLKILTTCFLEIKNADHIHLRCPGNTGMLAMIVSSLFPSKHKTIKYAGNWDPKSEQPISYCFQKWWLSNTILTRNAKVLVYGKWKNQSKNIVPFFTASFSENKEVSLAKEFKAPFRFIFCGSLTEGKRPLLAIQIIHQLYRNDFEVLMDIYGDGPEMQNLKNYIKKHNLKDIVMIHGNQPQEILKDAYIKAHFSLLPSKSEGWPKALAEGMFFGCIPIGTDVSCISWMLDNGARGVIIHPPSNIHAGGSVQEVIKKIGKLLGDEEEMETISMNAQEWSRQYTLERFMDEIHKIL